MGGAGLAGCLAGGAGGADALILFSWYDEWHEVMLEAFAENHGGLETSVTPYSSNQELYAKLKAGGTNSTDLVMPSNNMITVLQDDGMIQPIDTDRLERWSLQQPVADRLPWKSFVQSEGVYWGVPFTRGYYTNYAHGERVDDGTIPEDLVGSWDVYFDDHDGKVGIKDYGRRNVSIVLWHLRGTDADINEDPGTEVSWEEIEDELVRMIENSTAIYSSNEDAVRLFANGEIDVMNIWSGDVPEIRRHEGGEDARAYFPREGTNGWFDSYCIPAEAPHPELVHDYIDFTLAPENQARAVEIQGTYAVQPGVIDRVDGESRDLMRRLGDIDPTKLQPYSDDKDLQRRATEAWNNAKARAG